MLLVLLVVLVCSGALCHICATSVGNVRAHQFDSSL